MDTITRDGQRFIFIQVENVTQPERSVELLVKASLDARAMEKATKIAHYMKEQCKVLIPFFYEQRNETPRGRIRQAATQRASAVECEDLKSFYLDMAKADDCEIGQMIPLHSIVVDGSRVHTAFVSLEEADFVMFRKMMEIPFSNPKVWQEVEHYHDMRLAEESAAAEKAAGKKAGIDAEAEVDQDEDLDELSMVSGF